MYPRKSGTRVHADIDMKCGRLRDQRERAQYPQGLQETTLIMTQ